jgi:hypothetical protein
MKSSIVFGKVSLLPEPPQKAWPRSRNGTEVSRIWKREGLENVGRNQETLQSTGVWPLSFVW